MPQINVNTDLMQQMADHLGRYFDEMTTRQDQLIRARDELPTYWQGNSGQAALQELEVLAYLVYESRGMANDLRHHLLKARQAFEQAGLAGLNGVSLGGLESSWVPRSYAGGDQGALTGGQITGEEVLSNVSTFVTDQGPSPLSGDPPAGR